MVWRNGKFILWDSIDRTDPSLKPGSPRYFAGRLPPPTSFRSVCSSPVWRLLTGLEAVFRPAAVVVTKAVVSYWSSDPPDAEVCYVDFYVLKPSGVGMPLAATVAALQGSAARVFTSGADYRVEAQFKLGVVHVVVSRTGTGRAYF